MEIGSFIELEFETNREYHSEKKYGKENIIRLNSGRAGIYHAIRCYGVNKVYVPIYECDTVSSFLLQHNIQVIYYQIDETFSPILGDNDSNSAIVLSNYYGIFPQSHFDSLRNRYNNVIIDNAQAFFAKPIDDCINVYSARKFVGVPDGAYVIGQHVNRFATTYPQDVSSDTSLFLLLRHEYGCEGVAYEARKENELRIGSSDVMRMSKLTQRILDAHDYGKSQTIRKENYLYARKLFDNLNLINIGILTDFSVTPMVYPLLLDVDIIEYLHEQHIFQGHWWEYIVEFTPKESFEHRLSKYIVPITIDQRYSKKEIVKQYQIVQDALNKG